MVHSPPILCVQIMRWQGNMDESIDKKQIRLDAELLCGKTHYEFSSCVAHKGGCAHEGHYAAVVKKRFWMLVVRRLLQRKKQKAQSFA